MTDGLDEEEDILTAVSGRAAGKVAEIDTERLKRLQSGDKGSWFILNAQH